MKHSLLWVPRFYFSWGPAWLLLIMVFLPTFPLLHLSIRPGDPIGFLAHNICWMIAKLRIQALLSPRNSFSLYLSPLGMKLKLFFRNLFNQMESKTSLGPQISLWASSLYLGGCIFHFQGLYLPTAKAPFFQFCPWFISGHHLIAMHWKVKHVLYILIFRAFHRILWQCSQICWELRVFSLVGCTGGRREGIYQGPILLLPQCRVDDFSHGHHA